jgi:integrase/recombinase XerD
MASLKLRNGNYLLQFSKREDGKIIQKSFSLKTGEKRKAERLKLEYEDLYEEGKIDPFNGWSPIEDRQKNEVILQKKNIGLKVAAQKFIDERSQANDVTKKSYKGHLNRLTNLLGESLPVSMIRPNDIRAVCFKPDIAVATQRSYLTHYKVFFKWLYENEYIDQDLMKGIKPPKQVERMSDKVIDESDLLRLFDVFDLHITKNIEKGYIKNSNQKMEWFKPMVAVFFYAGLRSKELLNLRWQDIDKEFNFILVANSDTNTTKSGKARRVPIRKPLVPILQAWKKGNKVPSDFFVFRNVTDSQANEQMNKFRISQAFKRFARMAELPEMCNIHGLRHSFGTDLLRKGVPINQVSEMMGHSSIEVTKIYQHLTPTDLYESVKNID